MDIVDLIRELSLPQAFPMRVAEVETRQTHISAVFLADEYVYKVKKPVNFEFLDYSTLEKRKHFCEREVSLNQPLAPGVYLGVVPVTRSKGQAQFEGEGEPIEYAVKMRRLPESAHLKARVEKGESVMEILDELMGRMLFYYAAHPVAGSVRPTADCSFAEEMFTSIRDNAIENLTQTESHVGQTVCSRVYDRVAELTRAKLDELAPIFKLRATPFTRLTHGDLRLDHVYSLPHRMSAERLAVIDCIEFNERFRIADVVADLAFLAMDLMMHGRRDLASALIHLYEERSDDTTCQAVFPFYVAYRSVVRAKVRGFSLQEKEFSPEQQAESLTRARAHWLLALDMLAPAVERPGLLMIGGLPGSGKSTLAARLRDLAGFVIIRSDEVRKQLAGVTGQPARAPFGEGIYTEEWTVKTYNECFRRAEEHVREGRRVILDANFGRQTIREHGFQLANRLGTRSAFLVCQAEPRVIRERLAARSGDASDADWLIYEQAVRRWEPPGPEGIKVPSGEPTDRLVLEALQHVGLF